MLVYNRVPEGPPLADLAWAVAAGAVHGSVDARLRQRLLQLTGQGACTLTGSGRQALALALVRCGGRGEVLLPAYGCPIVAAVVRSLGMRPVFVDIEPRRFSVDGAAMAERITGATAAAVVVHEFGNPASPDTLKALRQALPGKVIEDCAVALGTRYGDGAVPGSGGDFAVFSGGLGKPVGAGAWGALLQRGFGSVPDGPIAQSVWRSLLRMGVARAVASGLVYALARPILDKAVGEDAREAAIGLRSPAAIDNRLVLMQLERLEEEAERRWGVARRILETVDAAGAEPMVVEGGRPMVGRIPFYVPPGVERARVSALFARAGIELRAPFQCNFSGATAERFPAAADALGRVLCLTYRRRMARGDFWRRLEAASAELAGLAGGGGDVARHGAS